MDLASEGSATRRFIRRLEVPPPKGNTYAITDWVNADLIPMDSSRRTWNGWKYVVYWATGGKLLFLRNYSLTAATNHPYLLASDALAAGILSPIVLVTMCILCGWPGGSHHITYTVVCRLAWGMRGSWFAVFFRVMPAVVWDGIEAWWGAQAISTMIGTWSLRWADWEHPLANGTMELKDFIGFIIYHFLFLAVMWLPPEKLHRPFHVSFVGFTMVIIGLVIWSTHTAGGGGQYFASDYKPPPALAGSIGWASVYGATAVLGNTAVVTMGGSAWCRFASENRRSMIAQAIACPIFIYAAFALGILVTSASSNVIGEAYWQPFLLLRQIQSHYNNSSGSRAAVFFASAALALAQVTVNMILNSVAAAMDMASYSPKWLTIRRCSYIIACLGICTNPWQITTTAATFIQVLSGFGTFYGPISGILVADFWIVRKRLIKMRDLYIGNEESIYWYSHGFNWRAFVTFAVSIAPALPGYIMSCANIDGEPNNTMKLSRLGFIIGFVVAVVVYPLLNFISPPRGLGEGVDHHDEDMFVLPSAFDQSRPTQGKYSVVEGVADVDSRDSDNGRAEKNVVGAEKF
ncbi:permease for cytosine/purines, uracil, thiamine, allantoin-domain-containing protein [Diaporthe sp. PMI_573]|nr:permease for cytosine/purines, uracil, thiamine, allantoin-domain-containing protein [Diaporthaceae sp. PMI_573]